MAAISAFKKYWEAKGHFGSTPERVAELAWEAALKRTRLEAALEKVQAAEAARDEAIRDLENELVSEGWIEDADSITDSVSDWSTYDVDSLVAACNDDEGDE